LGPVIAAIPPPELSSAQTYAISVRAKTTALDTEMKQDIPVLFHTTALSRAWLLKTGLVSCGQSGGLKSGFGNFPLPMISLVLVGSEQRQHLSHAAFHSFDAVKPCYQVRVRESALVQDRAPRLKVSQRQAKQFRDGCRCYVFPCGKAAWAGHWVSL
jgi:hypothetical protein